MLNTGMFPLPEPGVGVPVISLDGVSLEPCLGVAGVGNIKTGRESANTLRNSKDR